MRKIWKDLSIAGRIVVGIWALCLIALITFFVIRHNKDKTNTSNSNSNTPEVAQVYEPSIGAPLPADVKPNGSGTNVTATVENNGEVAGASTTTPSTTTDTQMQQEMIAPKTGIDPHDPVAYENTELKFSATLPAGAQVSEQASSVQFTSKFGTLYYIVSASDAGTETLQSIYAQLKNSPTASDITYGTLGNSHTDVIKFTAQGYGQGMAIIANGKIYYLLGNSQYFATFKL